MFKDIEAEMMALVDELRSLGGAGRDIAYMHMPRIKALGIGLTEEEKLQSRLAVLDSSDLEDVVRREGAKLVERTSRDGKDAQVKFLMDQGMTLKEIVEKGESNGDVRLR